MSVDNPRPWKKDVTKGEWEVGDYDEHLGYDCMTGGIHTGVAVLDGAHYGQKWCEPVADEAKAKMLADAQLIAEAGTVFHQTGMTPGELAERVRELEEERRHSATLLAERLEDAARLHSDCQKLRQIIKKFGGLVVYDSGLDGFDAEQICTDRGEEAN